MDITKIIVAVIGLLTTIVTGFLIPFLKSKLTENQQKTMEALAKTAVYAAEQLFTPNQWSEKKSYAQQILTAKGYNVNLDDVNAAIEAAVKELKISSKKQTALPETSQ